MNDSDESSPKPRPGVASTAADAESGQPGNSSQRSLFALEAMLKRGLISQADYEARKKAIESA